MFRCSHLLPKLALALAFGAALTTPATAADPTPTTRQAVDWSKIRGFNYQPSFGSTGVEIWIDKFDADVVDRELGLGHKYFPGMNTVRLWLSHDAFIKNPEQFSKNFEATLCSCQKHGIKAIPTLFNNWHSVPDFGGISQEMIGYWFRAFGKNGDSPNYVFRPYLEAMFKGHATDDRILAWDLCNEPFNSGPTTAYLPWLEHTYKLAKTLGARQPIGVSVGATFSHLHHIQPCSDVLMIHPYFAAGKKWDTLKAFAAKHKKPLLATETCWGSLDDTQRVKTIRSDLQTLTKHKVGFLVHALHESRVADLHRPQYGPVSSAGYMAFINMDGSLRTGHDVYNQFTQSSPPPPVSETSTPEKTQK